MQRIILTKIRQFLCDYCWLQFEGEYVHWLMLSIPLFLLVNLGWPLMVVFTWFDCLGILNSVISCWSFKPSRHFEIQINSIFIFLFLKWCVSPSFKVQRWNDSVLVSSTEYYACLFILIFITVQPITYLLSAINCKQHPPISTHKYSRELLSFNSKRKTRH